MSKRGSSEVGRDEARTNDSSVIGRLTTQRQATPDGGAEMFVLATIDWRFGDTGHLGPHRVRPVSGGFSDTTD